MNNFAILDIRYTPTHFGLLIALTTSTPCHLTCYYTEKKPLRHRTSRTTRGLTLPWGAYFCFVSWHALEQIEAGDTIYHTFNFEEWAICLTRWFTFRGTVADILSPSVGPIFEHHNLGPGLTRFEHYILGDNHERALFGPHWRGQTFTPSISHNIASVKLLLRRVLLPGQVTVSIRATAFSVPVGPDLCSGTIDGNSLTTDGAGEWKEITFDTQTLLLHSTMYAIVVRAIAGDDSNNLRWRADNSSPTYIPGWYVTSHTSGDFWTRDTGIDMMFEEYGYYL